MTGQLPRWCWSHQRIECSSLRRYRTARCHGRAIRGTGTCRHHQPDSAPATAPRELAHQLVSIAIAEGRLIRADSCELCGSSQGDWRTWHVEAHHEDYARPLDVIWLCVTCHRRLHGRHGGLPAYLVWLRAQLAGAERLAEWFYAASAA